MEPNGMAWHVYPCRIDRVRNADTIEVTAELRPGLTEELVIQTSGVDAPEPYAETRVAGEAAKAFVEQWVTESLNHMRVVHDAEWPFLLRIYGRGSFDTYNGSIMRGDGPDRTPALETALAQYLTAQKYLTSQD